MSSNITLHGKDYNTGNILPIAVNASGELIINTGDSVELSNLNDVSIAGLANTNLLQYDGTTGYWVNRSSLGGNLGFESQFTTQQASFNNIWVNGVATLGNLSATNLVVSELSNLANVGISANLDVLGTTSLANLSAGNLSITGLSNLANVGISANLDVLGTTNLANLSATNLFVSELSNLANVGISGNLDVLGTTSLSNISAVSLSITGLSNLANVGISANLDVLGTTNLANLSAVSLSITGISNLANVGISGNLDVLGTTSLSNISAVSLSITGLSNLANVGISGNLDVLGTTSLANLSAGNLYITGLSNFANVGISGNLDVLGQTNLANLSAINLFVSDLSNLANVGISGNLDVLGTTNLANLSATNLVVSELSNLANVGISGNLDVLGTTSLSNLSAGNISIAGDGKLVYNTDSTYTRATTAGNLDIINNAGNINLTAETDIILTTNTGSTIKLLGPNESMIAVSNPSAGNIYLNFGGVVGDSGYGFLSDNGILKRKNQTDPNWVEITSGGGGSSNLADLLDVQLALPLSNLDLLQYDIVSGKWVNRPDLTLGGNLVVSELSNLANVGISGNLDVLGQTNLANVSAGNLSITGLSNLANVGISGNLDVLGQTNLSNITAGNLVVLELSNLANVVISTNLDVLGQTNLSNVSAGNLVVSELSNLANVGISGNLDVLGQTNLANVSAGNLSITGLSNLANVGISANLDVLGQTNLSNITAGNLVVSELSNLTNVGISGNLDVLGQTNLANVSAGNLVVSELSNLANVGISGNLDVLGSANISNLTTGNLVVSGLSNLANVGISGNLDVLGQTNLSNVSAGNLVVSELSNLANVGISGNLDVLGATNLSNLLAGNLVVSELSNLANVGISGNLDVLGATNLANVVINGALDVLGLSNLMDTNLVGNLLVSGLSNLADIVVSGNIDVSGLLSIADITTDHILITNDNKIEFRDTTTYIQSAETGNLDIWATDGNINITANNDIVLTANTTSTIKLIGAGANSLAAFSNDGGANTTITLGQGNTNVIYLDPENMVLEQRNTGNLIISAQAASGEYLTQTINPVFDGQVGNIAIGGNVITYTSNTLSAGYFAYKKTAGTSWTTPPIATTGDITLVFDQSSYDANVNINLVSNNRKIKFNKTEYNNFNLFRDGYIEFTTGTPSDKFKFLNISNSRSAYPSSNTYYGWASITNPDDALVITYQDIAVQKVEYPPPEYSPVYSNLGNINLQVVLYSNNSPLYGTYDVNLGLCQGDANLFASYYGEIYGIPYSSSTPVPLSSYSNSFQTSLQYTDTYKITGRYNPQLSITNTAPLANGSIYIFSSNTQTTNKFGVKKWLGQIWTTQPPYVPNSATVISPLSGTPTNIDLGAVGRTIEFNQQSFSNIWITNSGAINFGGQYSSSDKLGVFSGLTLVSYPTTNIYYGFTTVNSSDDTLVITYSDVGYDYSGTTYGNLYAQVALFSNASPKSGTYELNYGVVATDTGNYYSYNIGPFGNSTNGNTTLSASTIPYEFPRIPEYNTIIRKGDVDISFPIDLEQDATYLNFGADKGLYGFGFRTIDNHDGYGTRFQFSNDGKGNWRNFINGSDGQIIYNDGGDYAGSYDLTFTKSTASLGVGGNIYAQNGGVIIGNQWSFNPPTMNSAGLFNIPLANLGALTVLGDSNLGNVSVGNLAITGAFSLNDIAVPGNLSVVGDSNLGNVSVGNLAISGAFSLNDIAVPGNLSVVGDSNLGNVSLGNLTITGAFSLNDIAVPGNLSVVGDSNLGNLTVGNISVLDTGKLIFGDANTYIQSGVLGNLDIWSADGNINITANHDIILTANSPSTIRLVGPGNSPMVAFSQDAGGNTFMSFGSTTGESGYGIKADTTGNVLLKSQGSPGWASIGNTTINIAGRQVELGGSNTIGFEDLTGSINSATQIDLGAISNDKLQNSCVSIAGQTVSLGGSADIWFSNLTGMLDTTTQLGDNAIDNGKLANSSLIIAGQTVSLGGSTSLSFSDLGGTVDNGQLTNSSLTIAGQTVSLGGSTILSFSDLGGTVDNGQLTNSSLTIAGQTVSLGGSASLSFSDLTGNIAATQIDPSSITNEQLAGSISNDKLSNSSITIGGQTISLGGSGSLAFSNITGSLNTGTQIDAGNIANSKLANTNIIIGGQTISLGGSGSLAFSNITGNIAATQIDPTSITNAQLAGSITNSKLANTNIIIGGQTISLGGSGSLAFSNITGNIAATQVSPLSITNSQLAGSIAVSKLASSTVTICSRTATLGGSSLNLQLANLGDVSLGSSMTLATGDFLKYDGISSKWINQTSYVTQYLSYIFPSTATNIGVATAGALTNSTLTYTETQNDYYSLCNTFRINGLISNTTYHIKAIMGFQNTAAIDPEFWVELREGSNATVTLNPVIAVSRGSCYAANANSSVSLECIRDYSGGGTVPTYTHLVFANQTGSASRFIAKANMIVIQQTSYWVL